MKLNLFVWPEGGIGRDAFGKLVRRLGSQVFYENGWLYAAQAMRGGGWIGEEGDAVVLIAAQNGQNGVPAIIWTSSQSREKLINVCQAVASASGSETVVIRHLDPVIAEGWVREDCRLGTINSPDPLPVERLSEERFPQVTIDLVKMAELSSARSCLGGAIYFPSLALGDNFVCSIRRGLRHAEAQSCELKGWREVPRKALIECARENAQWHAERLRQGGMKLDHGWEGLFEPVLPVISAADDHTEGIVLVGPQGLVHAFSLWETIAGRLEVGAVYAMASTAAVTCAMDLVLSATYWRAARSGIEAIALGGSEYERLFFFKSKPRCCWFRSTVALEWVGK